MALTINDLKSRRQIADKSFGVLVFLGGAAILVILGVIAYTITNRSTDAFKIAGIKFFTGQKFVPNATPPLLGILKYIFGTALTSLIAIVLAVPISLGLALFTTQVAPAWLKRPLVALTDLVAVVPSVVFGLWGIIFLAPKITTLYKHISSAVHGIPVLDSLFGKVGSGRSFMTAGLILAVMITPIITSISREVIETCPQTDRDGALALGATRWEMITGAVMPHSMGGIVGAVMLGLGRAMGETIAAALVIGSSAAITSNLFSSGDSLPAVIALQWGEANATAKSALIAMGLTLFVMTLVVNFAATAIVGRSTRRMQGAS
ncbi:MAG: phosphate transporter, inner rane subunit PstC [Ilumatobacteraceae bacterium]|nr:phosphate transporter, inner rane subunit PstC [Ilumatobacteraceae bacterium]